MEIKSLLTKKRLLFLSGDLPFDSLLAPENAARIRNEFVFETFSVTQKNGLPLFQGVRGQFTCKEKVHGIAELNIQPSSIDAIVEGGTEGVDYVLDRTEGLIRGSSAIERPTECKPIETAYETFCVARIETDSWWQLAEPYQHFINKMVFPKVVEQYPHAEPTIQPGSVQFRFFFKMKVPHHSIAPKTFCIELREGTPPEDRLFWTTSPLRSEEHLEILQEFEQVAGGEHRS